MSCGFEAQPWFAAFWSIGTGAYQPCLKPGDTGVDIRCIVAASWWCLEAAASLTQPGAAAASFRISCDDLGIDEVQEVFRVVYLVHILGD